MSDDKKKVLEEAFAIFDKDGSGKIDSKELTCVLKEYYKQISEEADDAKIESDAAALLTGCDESGDGQIDKAEFLKHFGF